ncbi:hypothetical protein K456DRAFT_262232 [Colletotrichum gloeosporioides 23]|nr:hypothetical protein K456DRAFT_262232 [Colletotrichum gloeosporioides 23]
MVPWGDTNQVASGGCVFMSFHGIYQTAAIVLPSTFFEVLSLILEYTYPLRKHPVHLQHDFIYVPNGTPNSVPNYVPRRCKLRGVRANSYNLSGITRNHPLKERWLTALRPHIYCVERR